MSDLEKKISDTIDRFHKNIFDILKLCKRLKPNSLELDSLNKKLYIARNIDPLIIIERSWEKIWTYRQKIVERDADFFLKNDFKQFIKNDENKTFMYDLINLIKKGYMERSQQEKDLLWNIANQLLINVLEYIKLTKER
jgi:hypothetical protein